MGEDLSADEAASAAEDARATDRRSMIKKTIVGAGAVGVVWAAPKVDGLSLRPDYAAAASSGGAGSFPFTIGPITGNSIFQQFAVAGGNVTGTWNGTGSSLTVNFTGGVNCGFTAVNAVNNTSADDPSNGTTNFNPTTITVANYGMSDLQAPGGNLSGTITCT